MAAAGRVEFGRYESTLERVWMAICFYASLSDDRVCCARVDKVALRAKRSCGPCSDTCLFSWRVA